MCCRDSPLNSQTKNESVKELLIFHSIHRAPRISHILLGLINKGLFQCIPQKHSKKLFSEDFSVDGIKCNRCWFSVCV